MKKEIIKIITLFIVVFTLIAYVPFRNYKQNGEKAIYSYFANDAFYYLTVADNYARAGIYSFDGVNPTNGFHPLWQFYLGHSFNFLNNKSSQLLFTFISSIIFTALGYFFIILTLYKRTKKFLIPIFGMIPGVFFLVFSLNLSGTYTSWSFINGMESCLTIFFFGIFIFFASGLRWFYSELIYKKIILVLLLIFISFSRLDDSFLLFGTMFFSILFKNPKKTISNMIIYIGIPVIAISTYLMFNYSYSGLLLPVSGMEKSGLSATNFIYLFNLFSGSSFNNLFGFQLYTRVLPLLITTSFAIYIIYENIKFLSKYMSLPKEEKFDEIMKFSLSGSFLIFLILSIYLLLKGTYNLLFVDFWAQGTWYFVLSVIIFNFIITEKIAISEIRFLNSKLTSLVIISLLIIYCNGYIESKRFEQSSNYELSKSKNRILNEIEKKDNKIRMIEMDDGIIAYTLEKPCLSGFGLNLDKEIWLARKEGGFLDEAYHQGYSYLASLNYFKKPKDIKDTINSIEDFARNPFWALKKENLNKWAFKPFIRDERTGLVIIEFERK